MLPKNQQQSPCQPNNQNNSQQQQQLCVISLLELRGVPNEFRNSIKSSLTLKTRLVGQVLETDPISIEDIISPSQSVSVRQELAWPVNGAAAGGASKRLNKVERTTVRLDCFMKFGEGSEDRIGYFVVDVKQGRNTIRKTPRRYRLISSTHSHMKLELSVAVYYECAEADDFKNEISSQPHYESNSPNFDCIQSYSQTNRAKSAVLNHEQVLSQFPESQLSILLDNLNVDFGALGLNTGPPLSISVKYCDQNIKVPGRIVPGANFADFNNFKAYLQLLGDSTKFQSWFERNILKFILWSGNKIVSSCSLDLSFYTQNLPVSLQEINLPMKTSSTFMLPDATPLSLFIQLKLECEELNFEQPSTGKSNNLQKAECASFPKHEIQSNSAIMLDQNSKRIFSLSIDFFKIRSLVDSVNDIYFKYKYFFMSADTQEVKSGIISRVAKGQVAEFPKSNCTFEFITTMREIMKCFNSNLLLIEIWSIVSNIEICIGSATVSLAALESIASSKIVKANKNNLEGLRKQINSSLYINSVENQSNIQFEIEYCVIFDIWKNDEELNQGDKSNSKQMDKQFSHDAAEVLFEKENAQNILNSREINEQEQYQRIQEDLDFKAQIESKLKKDFSQKQKDNDKIIQEKIKQYNKLEDKLHGMIVEVELKKKNLEMREQKIRTMRNSMNLEFEKKTMGVEDSINKLKFEHKMALADKDSKIKELEEVRKNIIRKLKESETSKEKIERQFDDFKEKFSDERMYQLKSQLEISKSEKSLLEKELELKNKNLEEAIKRNVSLKQKLKLLSNRGQVIDIMNQNKNYSEEDYPSHTNSKARNHNQSNYKSDDGLVSSTVKQGLKGDSVDYLVKELDSQIQQVLTDLER